MLKMWLMGAGFQALQTHRVAHWLWKNGRDTLAFYLQSQVTAHCPTSWFILQHRQGGYPQAQTTTGDAGTLTNVCLYIGRTRSLQVSV